MGDMGGASQFAGGGFTLSPAGGGRTDSAYGGGGGKKSSKSDTMRALTVRHLLKETSGVDDDPFIVDGQELGTITVVGRIISCQEQSTKAVMMLNDGTGLIEVTKWLNDGEDDPMSKPSEWVAGRYMRVYGTLKSFQGRKYINSYALKRIDDHNEVTHHFLKCVFEQLHLTRGAPTASATQAPPSRAAAGQQGGYGGAAGAYGAPAQQQQGGYGAAPPATGGMPGINGAIMALYNRPDIAARPQGMGVDEAVGMLRASGSNHTLFQVMQAAEFLCNEGLLYTTTDERTFKTTSA